MYEAGVEDGFCQALKVTLCSLCYCGIIAVTERATTYVSSLQAGGAAVPFDDEDIEELDIFDFGIEMMHCVDRWKETVQHFEKAVQKSCEWARFCKAGDVSAQSKMILELGDFTALANLKHNSVPNILEPLQKLWTEYLQPKACQDMKDEVKEPMNDLARAFDQAVTSVRANGEPPFLISACPPAEKLVQLIERLADMHLPSLQRKADFAGRYITLVAKTQAMVGKEFNAFEKDLLSVYSDFTKSVANMKTFTQCPPPT